MPSRRTILAGAVAVAGFTTLPALAAGAKRLRVRTRDGVDLYAIVQGAGPDVALVHGWPLNADAWDYQAERLAAAGFRVISYDRRGFGRSGKPAGGYDFDTFSDDLDAVLTAADARTPVLFGYSMGGGEVVRYVTRHGAARKVRGLGVIAGAATLLQKTADNPDGADASVFEGIKAGVAADRAAFLPGFLRDIYYDAGRAGTTTVTAQIMDWSVAMAMQASVPATVACVDAFARTDFRAELPKVTQPTLIVHGTADIPVPIDLSARYMKRVMPRAELVEYAGGSHGIAVTERDRLTADMLRWLKAL